MYKNEKRYALVNGVLLDGTRDMAPQTGKVICVDGSRIAAVTGGAAPAGYETVDLGGQYVLPGLINLHVHLPASGKPKKKPSDPKKLVKLITSNGLMRRVGIRLCEGYAKMELLSGVTTIRTVGGVADFDTIIRDQAAAGAILSPRVVASNMAVSVPGGHMAGSLAYEARTPEEAAACVEKIAAEKPDLIKLMITGGVMDAKAKGVPGELKMPPEMVKAVCDRAHSLGYPVAAHVESTEGVRVALENGVDSIEHGAKLDERLIRLFRDRGACLCTTLSPALPYALFDRSVTHATEVEQFNGNVVFEGIIACAKAALENDIPVVLGNDVGCPWITQYDFWRELCYFRKYVGVSNAFALHTATGRAAEVMGLGSVTGTIEVGKCADLIVTREDPLADLRALRSIDLVVARGRRYDAPRVKHNALVTAELDRFLPGND